MSDFQIDLDQGKVSFDGVWYDADELAARITQMLGAKDFHIGQAGQALEALQAAIADGRELTVKVPSSLLSALEGIAAGESRSLGEVVREALVRLVGQGPTAGGDGAVSAETLAPRPAPSGAMPVPLAAEGAVSATEVGTEAASGGDTPVPLTPKKKAEEPPDPESETGGSWFDRGPQS